MAWIPGYEQRYNQPLSPLVPNALGRQFLRSTAEAAAHPGVSARFDDIVTLCLLVRPHMIDVAKIAPPEYPFVVGPYLQRPEAGKKG